MKDKLTSVAVALTLALSLAAASFGAQAQQAGSWLGRIGATRIDPHARSGDLSAPSLPGSRATLDTDSELSAGITYMLSDNIAIDLPLALPFRHTVTGVGALAGVGNLGEFRVMPVTLFGQYRFGAANAKFRPYVGAGITYAHFYRERSTGALSAVTSGHPTTFSVDDKFGPVVQVGAMFMLNDKWFVDGSISKAVVKSHVNLSTGQSADVKLEPLALSIGVGMRFR